MHSIPKRQGHFVLESGLHADSWLELDGLFLDPAHTRPHLHALARQLRQHRITAVCGPLVGGAFVAGAIAARLGLRFYFTERSPETSDPTLFGVRYRLPAALRPQASGERFAVVDDAISAGSSMRATIAELDRIGAQTVVVGALMVLGEQGARYLAERSIPLLACARSEWAMWEPRHCPLCRAGVPIEHPR